MPAAVSHALSLNSGLRPLRQIRGLQGLMPASLEGRSVFGNCEETIHHHFPWHVGNHSSVKWRDVFAHGDVHGLHDVQLLQKLRTARRERAAFAGDC